MTRITLRGITWNHTRGYDPLVATAAAYAAAHPQVSIHWERRKLMEFGEMAVDRLAEDYDLVVLDHPWAGFIAEAGCYLAMDTLLPAAALSELENNAVGPSHRSYHWRGHQWALAIDAATMCASYRPDLLDRLGVAVPRTWDEVLDLGHRARAAGMTINMPLNHIDAISAFLSIVNNLDKKPFEDHRRVVDRATGERALRLMRAIAAMCPRGCFEDTPVTLMDRMGTFDGEVYCPLSYSYNNYARPGYRLRTCRYADMPTGDDQGPHGSHLGGAGLAISARCPHPDVAADYALRTAGAAWQTTVYFDAGGQPGHAAAWRDARVNAASGQFFRDTWESMRLSYLRPRYNGYIDFQHQAGLAIRAWLMDGEGDGGLMEDLDALYRRSASGGGGNDG